MQTEDKKELEEFVREALQQIKDGAKDHFLSEPVEFEVAVVKTNTSEGKMGIKVLGIGEAGGGSQVKTESISRIKFKASIKADDHYVGGVSHNRNTIANPDGTMRISIEDPDDLLL